MKRLTRRGVLVEEEGSTYMADTVHQVSFGDASYRWTGYFVCQACRRPEGDFTPEG